MKHLTFEEFISENFKSPYGGSKINESNVTGQAERAAEVFASLISKKTGKKFLKYPFPDFFTRDNQSLTGVKFFSNVDDSCIRINNSNVSIGLIDSVDIFYKSKDFDLPDYTVSSPSIPLASLIDDIAKMVKNPKKIEREMAEVMESVELNEARKLTLDSKTKAMVSDLLRSGMSAKAAAAEAGVAYKQVLLVKKGVEAPVKTPEAEIKNEQTLEDKVLYHNTLMEDILSITSAIAQKKFNSLMLTGRAGTGKTYNVEKALDSQGMRQDHDYFKITGSISTVEMFKKLYQFSDKILIFDDADSVFGTEDGRNILKAALDSKKVRRISYFKKLKSLFDPKDYEGDEEGYIKQIEDGLIPQSFEFTGQVIFISNLPKHKADPDGAIRSRSILIDVNPDDETLVGVMETLLPHLEPKNMPLEEKKEVFEFVKGAGDISMRTFVKAAGFKVAGLDNWKRMADRYI